MIPCLNEADSIQSTVQAVLRHADGCVVADADSQDETASIALRAGAKVVRSDPGRARQMNAGAQYVLALKPACRQLLFLHADTRLPAQWFGQITRCSELQWARFDVSLHSQVIKGWELGLLHLIAWFMNERSALTGICTGDQGLLVPAAAWRDLNGFPDIPLMEDIEMSRLLKRKLGRPVRLSGPIAVSPRRWEQRGVFRTMLLMWSYRLRWTLGESADSLHARYYGSPR